MASKRIYWRISLIWREATFSAGADNFQNSD